MAKAKSSFVCEACDAEQARWYGRCPDCGAWNTLAERAASLGAAAPKARGMTTTLTTRAKPMPMMEVPLYEEERIETGIGELDRVLGGGVVPGSVVLLGGDPGIGKSTLLLQVAQRLAAAGKRVLYASGEESAKQIRIRA